MKAIELDDIREGYMLPETSYTPSMLQLFSYAASTWNAHRIHYDYVYATQVEGYRNLVVQGPLIADFFTQHIVRWLACRGKIVTYEYSNRAVSYLGETLVAHAEIQGVNWETGRVEIVGHIRTTQGDIVLPARVTVSMQPKA